MFPAKFSRWSSARINVSVRGCAPEFRVLAYRISPDDGALTFTAEAPLPGSPTHISTDRKGNFVFSGSYNWLRQRNASGRWHPVETVDVVEGLEGATLPISPRTTARCGFLR
jgi:6-phosphogluconolactonase (cycloisomerase 2 family)